jgi:Ca-activated chloride channel family protein
VFRSDVHLVRLEVTVRDSNGGIATGLNKDDFEVSESGVPQQIAVFERNTSLPLSIAVLVDTSGSTYKDLGYEIESTSRFFRAVTREGNPDDAVALYSFNWQVTEHSGFSRNTTRLERALHSLRGDGGTSLYDAIYLASREIEDREGRHAMIVVTDGGDTTSTKDFDAALEAAQRAEAVLYPIVVVPIENPAGRNIGGEHALETIAARTGGRTFFPSDSDSLDQAFDDILQELRTQYLLAYYPHGVPDGRNRFHPVAVKVRRADLRAITRSGYYGESSP